MIKRFINRFGQLIISLFFSSLSHAAVQSSLIELNIPLHFEGNDIYQLEREDVEKYWNKSILTTKEYNDVAQYFDGINTCHGFHSKRKMRPFETPKVIYALESHFIINCTVLSELKKTKAISARAWELDPLVNIQSLKLPQCHKKNNNYVGIYSSWHPILKFKDISPNETIGLILIDYMGCGGTTYTQTEVRKVIYNKTQNTLYYAQE